MARDYEHASYDFWRLAEAALGVPYDEATLTIEPRADNRVQLTVSQSTVEHPRNNPHRPRTFSIDAETVEEGVETLLKTLTDSVYKQTFLTLLEALPSDEGRALERMATLFLQARHTVLLGSVHDDAEKIANRVKATEYNAWVQREVESIEDMIHNGDLRNEDAVREALNEIGVTYTSEAFDVLAESENAEAYWDQTGEEAPSWETLATCALQADVEQQLGFHPSDVCERDCLRCGRIVVTDGDEADNCPKCGLAFDLEECAGYQRVWRDQNDGDASTSEHICDTCLEVPNTSEEVDVARTRQSPLPADTEFECIVCGSDCYTGRKTPVSKHRCPEPLQAEPSETVDPDKDYFCGVCCRWFYTPKKES